MSAVIAGSLDRIAAALEELVRTVKEKENIPPTPPIREKETALVTTPRARTREKKAQIREAAKISPPPSQAAGRW